ncbi:unnamed protein product, partial [Prorocentrum cordatum]
LPRREEVWGHLARGAPERPRPRHRRRAALPVLPPCLGGGGPAADRRGAGEAPAAGREPLPPGAARRGRRGGGGAGGHIGRRRGDLEDDVHRHRQGGGLRVRAGHGLLPVAALPAAVPRRGTAAVARARLRYRAAAAGPRGRQPAPEPEGPRARPGPLPREVSPHGRRGPAAVQRGRHRARAVQPQRAVGAPVLLGVPERVGGGEAGAGDGQLRAEPVRHEADGVPVVSGCLRHPAGVVTSGGAA